MSSQNTTLCFGYSCLSPAHPPVLLYLLGNGRSFLISDPAGQRTPCHVRIFTFKLIFHDFLTKKCRSRSDTDNKRNCFVISLEHGKSLKEHRKPNWRHTFKHFLHFVNHLLMRLFVPKKKKTNKNLLIDQLINFSKIHITLQCRRLIN